MQKSKIWIHRNGITSFFGKLFKNCAFLGPVTSIKKKRQIILTLRSSCFLWFFVVEQTSITFKGWKVKDLRHLLTNHQNFFSESSFGIYIHVSKKNQLHQPGKPREHRLGEVLQRRSKSKLYIIPVFCFFKLTLVFIFKFHFDKSQNQSPGEPWEHHLGEVLQGRSKSKCNITLSYLIVLFFLVQSRQVQTI